MITPIVKGTQDWDVPLNANLTDLQNQAGSKLSQSANLADLGSATTARTNLGLGTSAQLAVGTTAGTVAAGDDARFSGASPWVFDVTKYGAVGDTKVVADGAMTNGSAVLTSSTAAWTTADVGKAISVKFAAATGVTTLVTAIASRQSATQVTLAVTAGATVTSAVVIWGTDDTSAIQSAVNAAETYLASHTYAQVFLPPLPYTVAGALNNSKSGNGQIVFGVYPTTDVKRILEFRGVSSGAAAVRHWQQLVPQFAGSCLVSLAVFASTAAQITSINADGNAAVISGPAEGHGYGAAGTYSNVMPVLKDLAIITAHSTFGLTYGAANLYGCANAHVENLGYGTAGTVASPSIDYNSPGTLATGLAVGLLLPAPGNNDYVVAKNISCGGGYTYALFLTEHGLVDRLMVLYCWAALVAVGTYASSAGSVHAMKVISASIESCTHELYIMGGGSGGIGPIIDIDQLSTESGTPNITGNNPTALASALGRVKLTGLFTPSGVSVSSPTGIELINGQVAQAVATKTATYTTSVLDRTILGNTTAGGFTVTLISAVATPNQYSFRNIGTANTLTVATTGGQTINGSATLALTTGQSARLVSNGANWFTV